VDEFDDDPTHVDDLPAEFDLRPIEDEPITAPHDLVQLPGFELGFTQGYELGVRRAMAGLRLALLSVGVPPHEVQPIVDRVNRYAK
jgi:hypothetical protein